MLQIHELICCQDIQTTLKKTSDNLNDKESEDKVVLDVNDNLFEINILDSSQFEPKTFASCDLPYADSFEKCDCSDMEVEQTRDEDVSKIRSMILNG